MEKIDYRPQIVDPGIGGGHTYFGILVADALKEHGMQAQWVRPARFGTWTDKAYWAATQVAYVVGARGGKITDAYEHIRDNANQENPLLQKVQQSIQTHVDNNDGTVVATHAYTAVAGKNPLVLIQGDVFAGADYALKKADSIVVPTQASQDELVDLDVKRENIEVVGFFVPKSMTKKHTVHTRLSQLASGKAHVGIYLSGASPLEHQQAIKRDILPSLAPSIKRGATQVSVYSFTNNWVANDLEKYSKNMGLRTTQYEDDASDGNWQVRTITGTSPQDAIRKSIRAADDEINPINIMVTMANERIGWTAGMALAPLSPINRIHSGGNTNWGVELGLFLPPSATTYIGDRLCGTLVSFQDQIRRGRQLVNANGAENTAHIIKQMKFLY